MAVRDLYRKRLAVTFPKNKYTAFVVALGSGLFLWSVLAIIFPGAVFPYPHAAFVEMGSLIVTGSAWPNLWATLYRTFWGFLGATILGIALGVVMGINTIGRQFFTPYLFIGLSIPGIAWAAVTTLIFGLGDLAPIVATVVTAFPFIAINVWKGVEDIDHELIRMSKSFGISSTRLLRRMILPSVAPGLFTAFRYGIAISWKVETSAEIFAVNQGVGIRMLDAFEAFRYAQAWGWALLFMIVLILIEFGVIKPLEQKVFDYRQDIDFEMM